MGRERRPSRTVIRPCTAVPHGTAMPLCMGVLLGMGMAGRTQWTGRAGRMGQTGRMGTAWRMGRTRPMGRMGTACPTTATAMPALMARTDHRPAATAAIRAAGQARTGRAASPRAGRSRPAQAASPEGDLAGNPRWTVQGSMHAGKTKGRSGDKSDKADFIMLMGLPPGLGAMHEAGPAQAASWARGADRYPAAASARTGWSWSGTAPARSGSARPRRGS
jgi:hypothetical protein